MPRAMQSACPPRAGGHFRDPHSCAFNRTAYSDGDESTAVALSAAPELCRLRSTAVSNPIPSSNRRSTTPA
jgi:hypothetical protein